MACCRYSGGGMHERGSDRADIGMVGVREHVGVL